MKTLHQRGLALISLLIVVGCILVIGGVIVYWLAHLAKRLLDPPPHQNTNTVSLITITLPNFTFPPLAAPADSTPERPTGSAYFVLERSTNLLDWEPVLTNTGVDSYQLDHTPDTSIPMEFYRGNFVYPK